MQQEQATKTDGQAFDQKPIGQSQKPLDMMSEYPPDFDAQQLILESRPQPLPLAKRVHSKVWKIRKQAFQQLLNEVSDNYSVYQEYFKDTVAFVTDSHPICQEKALRVLLKYLEAADCKLDDPKALLKALIEKCLVVEKGQTNNITTEIMFWLMDHHPQVLLNEINENILNKNPKISASVIVFLQKLLNNYGAKKLKGLQEFGKSFTILSSSVRPTAKAQSIALFKQMYKWMGQQALSFNMHPEVKEEVVKFSKTYVKQPMAIKRGLNQDQKKGKKPIIESMDDDQNMEPQDVLVPYDSRWVDKVLEQPKWKDKKQILDQFIKKTKAKNIVPRQSTQFITLIKRLMTQNNINLLQCGFKVTKNLCIGLKKNFTHPCKSVMASIFSKLRDSKIMIVDEAQQTLQAMMNCLVIEDLAQELKQGLKDKAPTMRLQTLKFIEKLVMKRDKKMINVLKLLTGSIIDLTSDGSLEVRDKALDVLCKMKGSFGINFFGEKLKKIQGKKAQTIQNYIDPNYEHQEQQQKLPPQVVVQNNKSKKQTKLVKTQSPSNQNLQSQSLTLKSSMISQPLPKVSPFNPTPSFSQFESPSQNTRLQAYQSLLQKPPQVIHQQLIEGFKNKIPMARESNPNILRVILQCVKKSVHSVLGLEHIELLTYHDWRKCKSLLVEFIQGNKINLGALEFVKNQGLLGQSHSVPTKRGLAAERLAERESYLSQQGSHAGQTNNNSNQNNSIHNNNTNGSHSQGLKTFYSQIQPLIPKMSSPDPSTRLHAVQTAMQMLKAVPIGAPTESSVQPSAPVTEAMAQLFNVLKFRVQDNNEQIANNYIKLVTQMLAKGFLTKFRTPGRLLMSIVLQRLPNPRLPSLKPFLHQMTTNHAPVLWQFLLTEILKQNMCVHVLNVIKDNNQSFFRNADQKGYMLPLLTCISRDVEVARCGELLDQIVEINGEQCLEKVMRESKLQLNFGLDTYLKKWHITGINHQKPKLGPVNPNSNLLLTHIPISHSKLERLTSQIQNPWPLNPTSSHFIKLMAQMISLGEPFQTLATPTHLTDQELSLLTSLPNELIEDFSDILTKWVFWRVNIQFLPKNMQCILNLMCRLITPSFTLHETEIVLFLTTLLTSLHLHRMHFIEPTISVNRLLNQHPLYQEKSFRFWINSFNDPTTPVDEVLQLLVSGFPDMIPSQLVTLARFPAVVRHKEFNLYLKSKYSDKLLSVYGFKIQDAGRFNQKQMISDSQNPDNTTDAVSRHFIELFQRSASSEIVQKIVQETSRYSNQFIMQAHTKIMSTIIVPYLHRELPFINVYNYFKHLQKVMVTANLDPFLLSLVKTLSFFLVDLDESKLQGCAEMLKTINKSLLILLQVAEPRHILEVLFVVMKQQLKTNGNMKLTLLLVKCVGKVIKTNLFKSQYERNSENIGCLEYLTTEFVEILSLFDISVQSSFLKAIKSILCQMTTLYPDFIPVLENHSKTHISSLSPSIIDLLYQITHDASRVKENDNGNISKMESSVPSSEEIHGSVTKEVKKVGDMLKAMRSGGGERSGNRRQIEKEKMDQ